MNLFEHAERYPNAPGWKAEGTSREAAEKIAPKAATCRREVLRALESSPRGLTAPEMRKRLNNRYTLNCIRSRLTELSRVDGEGSVYAEKTNITRKDPETKMNVAVYRSLLFRDAV